MSPPLPIAKIAVPLPLLEPLTIAVAEIDSAPLLVALIPSPAEPETGPEATTLSDPAPSLVALIP